MYICVLSFQLIISPKLQIQRSAKMPLLRFIGSGKVNGRTTCHNNVTKSYSEPRRCSREAYTPEVSIKKCCQKQRKYSLQTNRPNINTRVLRDRHLRKSISFDIQPNADSNVLILKKIKNDNKDYSYHDTSENNDLDLQVMVSIEFTNSICI